MKGAPGVDGLEWSIRRALDIQAAAYSPTGRNQEFDDERQTLTSKPRRSTLVVVSLVGVLVLAVAVWVSSRGSESNRSAGLPPSSLTVPEVYHRVARALTRPGQVYHQSAIAEDVGDPPATATSDLWIDVGNDVARREFGSSPVAWLVTGEEEYLKTKQNGGVHGPAESCFGVSASVIELLGCPTHSKTLRTTKSVREGVARGRPAVVLVTDTRSKAVHVNSRLYLDKRTFLPILATQTVTERPGGKPTRSPGGTLRDEFVSADSLPTDFFTTASVDAWVESRP